ncbi:MAG: response regulator, partial [Acidobacteriaceae bacterium]|nr:response regulator [Acidobacteriaceae bacterium]
MQSPVQIVMVEDSPLDAELELAQLKAGGIAHEVRRVDSRAAFTAELNRETPDLILCDYVLPGFDGLAALAIAQQICPHVPFLFVSGAMGEEIAIESLKHGATDYVLKQRLERLAPAVTRALSEARQRRERAQAEEELARKMRELSVLNADLEQFVHAAHHDLQEPLRMISLFSKLLATRYQGKLDTQAGEYLEHIETGARRMSALLEDLLVYAKVPLRDDPDERADLNVVVDQTVSLFKHALEQHRAIITRDPLPVALGSGERFGLVFQNLIANALKYRAGRATRIHISASPQTNSWVVSVKDNGIGFNQAYGNQIFELFRRLDKDTDGTGLGLAICKRIIDLYGGRIWAESKPDLGSTFF